MSGWLGEGFQLFILWMLGAKSVAAKLAVMAAGRVSLRKVNRCSTARLSKFPTLGNPCHAYEKSPPKWEAFDERETRFELATPTLARLCSTS